MAPLRPMLRRFGSALVVALLMAGCAWLVVARGDGGGVAGEPPAVLARTDDRPVGGPVDPGRRTATTVAPAATAPQPMKPGDDPTLDGLWHGCQQGSGAACDQLFQQAPVDSGYEAFGLSCGNRPDILHCGPEMDAPPTTVPPPTFPPPPGPAATR